jgi:hypothetical protein
MSRYCEDLKKEAAEREIQKYHNMLHRRKWDLAIRMKDTSTQAQPHPALYHRLFLLEPGKEN